MPLSRRRLLLASIGSAAVPQLSRAQEPAGLELGLLPNLSARVLLTQYEPMVGYLGRELRQRVSASTAVNWATFHKRTVNLDYDLVVTAANLARLAQVEAGWVPLLRYKPDIKGLLVCLSARPLADAQALRGRTLVLSNPQSLVTLRGLEWMASQGLQQGRDFSTTSVPTDDSVGNVVVRGDAVAALLSGGEFRAIPDAVRSQLQVMSTFAEVTGFVLMASPRMAVARRQQLAEHLARFAAGSDEGRLFFERTGFNAFQSVEAGVMEALQPYVEATRRVLAPA